MKILRVWLIAICLSTTAWSNDGDLETKIAQFAHSPEWLGHFFYNGSADAYTSLVESNHYFLSKTGKYNPADELREVVRRLSAPDEISEENYCHYIGRYELVLGKFPDLRKSNHMCKAFEDWSQKLSVDEVRLAFATGYMKNPASSFGHLFLKLISKKQTSESLNYGINFSARTGTDSGALYALKGLFGEYPGGFALLPYHQLIKDYSDLEGRDVWELDLDLDANARRRLLFFIYEFDSNYIEYTFLNNNCAGVLEGLVYYLQGRPTNTSLSYKPWTIPLESFQDMAAGVNQKHFFYIPSLKTQLGYMEDQLSIDEKQRIKSELKQKKFSHLSARELDYVILDKKLNESQPDENYSLELMKARSRVDAEKEFIEIAKEAPKPNVVEKPRTASVAGLIDDNGPGLDLNFLNERMIHGRNLSEINALNFRVRTTENDKRPVLKEAEIFSFLAAESINFLRSPVSYGAGIFYRDKRDLAAEINIGYLWHNKKWLYFPKLNFVGDKFHTDLAPAMDVLYFSEFGNWKLTANHNATSLEFFKYLKYDCYIDLNLIRDNQKDSGLVLTMGVMKFF